MVNSSGSASDTPLWFGQLPWSSPTIFSALSPSSVPPGAGLYVFTRDAGSLTPGNTLYVGKADGARQTLRNRLGVYRRRFAAYPGGSKTTHAGLELLAEYYGSHAGELYIRWAGVIVARELEGSLIGLLSPEFNQKDEHRIGYADDELIPNEYLYSWP